MDEKGCKSERDSTWSDEIVNEMAVARRNAFLPFLNFYEKWKNGERMSKYGIFHLNISA